MTNLLNVRTRWLR